MQSRTFALRASSAAWRSTSAARFFSSAVGPVPEKTPSGEWYGPHRFSPPRMAVISMAHLMRSTAAWRTAASGLIGLASGVMVVTAVQPRPWSSSCLRSAL